MSDTLIRRRARRLRRQIIAALGAACACCGETVPHALTIDHRLNDGHRERREFPDVRDLYRHVIEQGIPRERYVVLCRNCHESKNAEGLCAHEAEAKRLFLSVAA